MCCAHICNEDHVVICSKSPLLNPNSEKAQRDDECYDNGKDAHPYRQRDTLTTEQHVDG